MRYSAAAVPVALATLLVAAPVLRAEGPLGQTDDPFADLGGGPAQVEVDPPKPVVAEEPPAASLEEVDRLLDLAYDRYRDLWMAAEAQERDIRFWRIFRFRDRARFTRAVEAAGALRKLLETLRQGLETRRAATAELPPNTPETLLAYAALTRRVTDFDTLARWASGRVLHYDTLRLADQERIRVLDSDPVDEVGFPGYYGKSWYQPSAWFSSRVRLPDSAPSQAVMERLHACLGALDVRLAEAGARRARLLDLRTRSTDLDASAMGSWIHMRYDDLPRFERDVKPVCLDFMVAAARAKGLLNEYAILADGVLRSNALVPAADRWQKACRTWGELARWGQARLIDHDTWRTWQRTFRIFEDTRFATRHLVGTGGRAATMRDDGIAAD